MRLVDPNVVGAGKPNFGIGTTVVDTTGGNDLMISQSKRPPRESKIGP
jgi:hypothetical protein